jgi:hypothetical protein
MGSTLLHFFVVFVFWHILHQAQKHILTYISCYQITPYWHIHRP